MAFQAAAIPHHLFRRPPDKTARRTPALRSSRKVFCSVFSHMKLSGVAKRLNLAAGKNCDAKSAKEKMPSGGFHSVFAAVDKFCKPC